MRPGHCQDEDVPGPSREQGFGTGGDRGAGRKYVIYQQDILTRDQPRVSYMERSSYGIAPPFCVHPGPVLLCCRDTHEAHLIQRQSEYFRHGLAYDGRLIETSRS